MSKLRNQFFLAMLLTALATYTVHAQDEKKQEKKTDSAEEKSDEPTTLNEIRAAMSKAQSEIIKDLRGTKPGSPEYSAALAKYYGVADGYADKIIAAVKKDPSNRVGASMLSQLAQMTRKPKIRNQAFNAMLEVAKADAESQNAFQMLQLLVSGPSSPMLKGEAMTLLMKNFGDSDKLGDLAMSLTRFRGRPSPTSIQFLRDILEKATSDNVKGPATYALGKMLSASKDTKAEGMELIKSIPEKFADVKVYGGRANLAKMVEGEIFELEHLQIGMDVPDIEGEDVDGVKFKLSDYKGKVVVIDFWGDW